MIMRNVPLKFIRIADRNFSCGVFVFREMFKNFIMIISDLEPASEISGFVNNI